MQLAWARPQSTQFSRRQLGAARLPSPTINYETRRRRHAQATDDVQVWVHDQDEALAFYTEKLGLELREDVTVPELGDFRWLSVGVPGQDESRSR